MLAQAYLYNTFWMQAQSLAQPLHDDEENLAW